MTPDPPTSINERAPVVGTSEIEIAAAPEVVWDVLTAIDGWPLEPGCEIGVD